MQIIQAESLYRHPQKEMRYLGEYPQQCGKERLSWVSCECGPDSKQGAIHILDLNTLERQTHKLPGRVGFAIPESSEGQFLVGCEQELGMFDSNDGSFRAMASISEFEPSGTCINHGISYQSAVFFGSKNADAEQGSAGLYVWVEGELIRLRDSQDISNGKAVWERDGNLMLIDIDSPSKIVTCSKLSEDLRELGDSEVVLDFREGDPVPGRMSALPGFPPSYHLDV